MSIAQDLINDARNYASDQLANATAEMNTAFGVLDSLRSSGAPPFPALSIGPPLPGDPGEPPAYAGSHFERVTFDGEKPTLNHVPSLTLPPSPGTAPAVADYVDPQRPGGEPSDVLLQDIPSLDTTLVVPTSPDLLSEIRGIAAPPLLNITIPDAPNFVPPEFLGVRPDAAPDAPTGLDATMRTQYATISPIMRDAVTQQFDVFLDREFPQFRTGMAAIETRLATYLAGGSALTVAVENALYNRTLDKTDSDANRATRKAQGAAARAGFTIMPAILLAQQVDLDQERRSANARAATEIYIKQAELEQSNLQFAVTQSASLRNIAINAAGSYYNGLVQINGQALEYSRSVVDAIVKAYDISARHAEIQARLYEADAAVYRARLEGALAVIEAYKAKIQGLEAQAQVNVAQVQAYKTRIEAVEAEAQVYRAQVDAVVAQANIQRVKVDLYQAKVQAYGAQVNAYTARWQGYAAAVAGQGERMKASVAQQQAFVSKVEAYKAQVQAKAIEIDSLTRVNQQLIEVYKTDVEAFAALNRAEAEAVHAEVESFDTTIKAFIAKANAISERSRANIASYEVALRAVIAQADLYLNEVRETNRVNVARVEGTARVAVAAGEIFAGIAQSSLSGMNSLASINLTESS